MKLVESSNEYLINDTEYFYNLDSPSYHPTKILSYIPKLMANIVKGAPAFKKDSISSSIFCNDSSCKPKPDTIVNTQNFITLTNPPNLSPSFYKTSKGGKMIKDTKHIVGIYNKDIRQMHFIEDR